MLGRSALEGARPLRRMFAAARQNCHSFSSNKPSAPTSCSRRRLLASRLVGRARARNKPAATRRPVPPARAGSCRRLGLGRMRVHEVNQAPACRHSARAPSPSAAGGPPGGARPPPPQRDKLAGRTG